MSYGGCPVAYPHTLNCLVNCHGPSLHFLLSFISFNRSAQSARLGPCVPRGLKGDKEEQTKDEGNIPLRTEAEKVTEKFLKHDPQIWKNLSKRKPKSLKIGPEIEPRATRNPNHILGASWERPQISRLASIGTKLDRKIVKNVIKIC